MRTLTSLLTQRRERKRKDLEDRGFDYAAGCLLRGESEQALDARIAVKDFNAFDFGMLRALREWQRQVKATDQ